MELGILTVQGINEACEIALMKGVNVKLRMSPKYYNNSYLDSMYDGHYIGGHNNGVNRIEVDITDAFISSLIYINCIPVDKDGNCGC